MTSNLESITGLGHFLVVLHGTGHGHSGNEDLLQRLRRLQPEIPGGRIPPAVQTIGRHAVAAAWGDAKIDTTGTSTVIGVFQRTRHDVPGVNPASLRALAASGDPAAITASALAGANFAAVVVNNDEPRALALTAPFRQLPLYRACLGVLTAFATDARLITELGIVPREMDDQALYHYLNFSCVPAPYSIFRRIRKVPAGTQVRAMPGTTIEEPYWRPRFEGSHDAPVAQLEEEFREQLYSTVRAHRPGKETQWGAFLSGGTDSSSITGILATEAGHDGESVRTYSIGFRENGYDELAFARIAATHFGADSRCRHVDEHDTMAAIPELLSAYDEPYGNASAVPTYYCAAAAATDGVHVLVAGDGGDESFGGNERYAKDAVYRAYEYFPQRLRSAVARWLRGPSRSGTLLENRIRHFAQRGALANPERFYREESFASDYFDELLAPGLRGALGKDSSLAIVSRHYEECAGTDALHRLMYVDLMMAIADNDLVKVQRASQAAGVCVSYPYLDTALVGYAGRLHARWKVKGLEKRYLFKRALRDLLPASIINKPKHGFGLPIALWMRRDGPLRALTHDTLRSRHAAERGYFEQGFIEGLLDAHDHGSWDFSPELWRL
ncbi:MAG TPA: asparagine synthase C-terminal domain-containing protein, partial [Gammaproteobacteria bacterium]